MNAENVENCGLSSEHSESAAAAPSTNMLVDDGTEIGESAKYENVGATTTTPTKRKTRRFKFRNKADKKSKYLAKARRISGYPQSEAPYNTNQFLMADHKLSTPPMLNHADEETTARNRDSSFTDGDDDEFYAAPEHEDEFLTKDFDDTYQTLNAERLGSLSKTQLTKIILDYEAKVEELNKKLRLNESCQDNSINRVNVDKFVEENAKLRLENAELKQLISQSALYSSSCGSSVSFTSESDSTTTNESRIRVHINVQKESDS